MTSDLFVRSARTLLAMTQQGLATALGKSRFTIARYENGDAVPEAIKLAILHLMQQRNIDPDQAYACITLPNRGRRKPNRSVPKLMKRIKRQTRRIRAGVT